VIDPAVKNARSSRTGYSGHRDKVASGFTLLEVMVAIAVLAIALTALISSQSRTMLVADASDFLIMSAHLGSMQMSAVLEDDDLLTKPGANFDQPYPGYSWQVQVKNGDSIDEDILSAAAQDGRQRIDLHIRDNRRDQSFSIIRYRFGADLP